MKKAITIIHVPLVAMLLMAQPALADYINSIGMVFKNIPAGSFYMGSCQLSPADNKINRNRKFLKLTGQNIACPADGVNDNNADDNETPRHKVHIKRFQIGIHEITVGQFKQFIRATSRHDLLTDSFIGYNRRDKSVAVTVVSWHDAQAFIRWLNKKEGGTAYRLPTEAEWEYAARATTNSIYSWGNSAESNDYAWSVENASGKYAQAVGGKQANPWGLYDMHGNVWEWVQDGYSRDYYRNSTAKNPLNNRPNRVRVFRGGSWKNEVWFLRSADRGYGRSELRGSNLGFRLVRQL